ncbi:hypothetical protein ACM91E_28305, partial [Escherichia coli]|uniref:hypothetical protein n=1 Tax=Escherichia coli TaxID=562 RepID=UPI003B9982FC
SLLFSQGGESLFTIFVCRINLLCEVPPIHLTSTVRSNHWRRIPATITPCLFVLSVLFRRRHDPTIEYAIRQFL